MGVFGATAAAGKLMDLSADQMLHAFGIAYSHAAGNRQCILDGALTKRMQAGQAASAGVFSAVLAQTGFTGAHNVFNGRFGFLELYQPNGHDASFASARPRHGFSRGGAELQTLPLRPAAACGDRCCAGGTSAA
jgi:2-methylcitrate dehydratase PrpD